MRDIGDDEQLLAALREALEADEAVPPEFIELGKNAYAWHNIDAELAQLTYDSVHEPDALSLRAEAASIRALTFTSAHLTIELEVSEDSVLGQVVPAQCRHDRDPGPGGRDRHHRSRRGRLLSHPPHPRQPVPATLPYRGRLGHPYRIHHALILSFLGTFRVT